MILFLLFAFRSFAWALSSRTDHGERKAGSHSLHRLYRNIAAKLLAKLFADRKANSIAHSCLDFLRGLPAKRLKYSEALLFRHSLTPIHNLYLYDGLIVLLSLNILWDSDLTYTLIFDGIW